MMETAEQLLKSQDEIRQAYRRGDIDEATRIYDAKIAPSLDAVDPRISTLAHRLSISFIQMVDDEIIEAFSYERF
jgi:hypothetical protein